MVTMSKCPQCGAAIRFEGLCLKCRKENEKKAILEMSAEELEKEINDLAEDYDEDRCALLIRLRGINTERLARTAWENKEFGFAPVYKDAPDDVISEMIDELLSDETDSKRADKLLVCLAHKGGEAVLNAFRELKENPREWRKKLYVDPHFYAQAGGWAYDKDGNVSETVFRTCYPIVKTSAEAREKSPVKLITAADGVCGCCGSKLVNLIELDGRDERLKFLGMDGKIVLKSCLNCLPYNEPGFVRFDLSGWSEFVPEECDSEEVDDPDWVDEFTENTFALAEKPMPEYYPFDDGGGSAVGGFPFWPDECVIYDCPDCGKWMICLAQIGGDVHGLEGNIVVEVCRECKTAAVLYQQT